MSALNFVLTNAGRAAISQVGALGPVVISEVAIGSNGYTATVSQTALQAQIKRLAPSGSSVPTAGTLHITVQDSSADAYTVREIGIYTSTGVLFAVYSQTANILVKASESSALFALDIVISNVPAGSVTIGNAVFQYPPATETVKGVAELATSAEVQTGTDAERIVTPVGLSSRTATNARTGLVELATDAETQSGTDAIRAVTPAGLSSRTATDTRAGIVELATETETLTGTDATRAVTPAGLKSSLSAYSGSGHTHDASAIVSGTISNSRLTQSTTSSAGIVELADNTETQTGTDATRAVTPAGLSSRTATDARTGLVELATDAETQSGTDAIRAVTPAGLSSRTATDTRAGIVELADNAETQTGTDATRAVSPASLVSAFQKSFSAIGHQKLPGGLIINWGSAGLADQTSQKITFSMAFPTGILSVAAVAVTQAQDNWASVLIDYTNSNFKTQIQLQREGIGNGFGGSNTCFFIAIGY